MRTEERIGNYLHVNYLLSSPGIFYEQYTWAISCTTYAGGGGDVTLLYGLHTWGSFRACVNIVMNMHRTQHKTTSVIDTVKLQNLSLLKTTVSTRDNVNEMAINYSISKRTRKGGKWLCHLLNLTMPNSYITEHHSQVGSTTAPHSRGYMTKSQSRDWLSKLRTLWFSSLPSVQMPEDTSCEATTCFCSFCSHPFQFVIHWPSYYSGLHTLLTALRKYHK